MSLQQWDNNGWQNLDTGFVPKGGAGTIDTKAGFNCHHTAVFAYRTEAFAYAVVNSVGYTAVDCSYKNHTCWP